LLSLSDFQSFTGMVNHKRYEMQKRALIFQRCFQNIVILVCLASIGTQANAQKGVIVIQGEITTPTCLVANINIQPVSQVKAHDKYGCVGYIEPLSAKEISTQTRVTDQALVNQAINERIKTVTYR